MNQPITVDIIAAPVACTLGVQEQWRDVATFVAGQLATRFGNEVEVRYYNFYDADCPPLPPGAELPVVRVAGEVLSCGGKVSVPLIRRRLEALRQPVTVTLEKDV